MKRVGYWFSEKKIKKLNFQEYENLFRLSGIELVQLNLTRPLTEQGPFDAILHKLVEVQAQADSGDETAQEKIANLKDYLAQHPECIIVDPLPSVCKLLDRYNQYRLVKESRLFVEDCDVFMPTFAELTSNDIETNRHKLAKAQVTYPFVCKPIVAHGSKLSHKMAIVFNEAGLSDLDLPCVAQSFINHNAVLYKIYAVGSKQFIAERPSLKNLLPGDHETICFDSHDVSKRGCSHYLTIPDKSDVDGSPLRPDRDKLHELANKIREVFGLDLFGVDVIVDCDTMRYAIIDINSFPGYDEVEDFATVLLEFMQEVLTTKGGSLSLASANRTKSCNSNSKTISSDTNTVAFTSMKCGTTIAAEEHHRDQDMSEKHQSSRKRLKSDHDKSDKPLNGESEFAHKKTLDSINGLRQFSNSVFHGNENELCSNVQLREQFSRHTNGHH